jgi:RNA polymerase sigma-70 factor (ECF subfamily)
MKMMHDPVMMLQTSDEASAIEKAIAMYRTDVYRLAYSILEDPHEAEDGAQDTLLAALCAYDSFHGDSSLKTWLFAITINICRTRLRRRRVRRHLDRLTFGLFNLQENANCLPEESALQNEADRAVWRAVHRLDEKHRLPVLLRYYHDLPVAEIAAMLDIPAGTVHSRLNVARRRLRRMLEEERK